ncbi:SLC13 family permease [Flexithrix dorotheae]|uniref:SLC13 family permease n=1 Tax=Flexithrix dorotheae TaxID=70993 RepID=UPI000374F6DE|nr:DASS family sodium-coupled anion symporter [Flexithrix dorotheae]
MNTSFPLTKKIGLFLGPILFFIFLSIPVIPPLNPESQKVIAIASLMISWWISEAVELPVTALVPIVLLPFTGVLDIKEATAPYSSPIVFLFMGGFVVALGMEKYQLHKRIALNIVSFTGTNANGIILGFMLATAFLSMWISNTATTVMMLPIAVSVISLLSDQTDPESKGLRYFSLAIMLGIAYSANVGGISTLIGTPPNSVFAGFIYESMGFEISFLNWMLMAFPFTTVLLFITYFFLVKILYPNKLGHFSGSAEVIRAEKQKLGVLKAGEKRVLIVFICTAVLWISRSYINPFIPFVKLTDAGIAMTGALALFLFPINYKTGEFVLEWKDTTKLPWGILILFGGGLTLAAGMEKTGIIDLIGESVADSGHMGNLMVISILITIMLFMTELMSNVALVTILLPVVAGVAKGLDIDPLLVAIPVTMASSCAFMLPMATPPNAIVFASGHIKVSQMVKAGIYLNIISVILLIVLSQTLVPMIFS